MAALRATWSFVREYSNRFKPVMRQLVGRWLKYPGIKGTGYAMAPIGSSIEDRAMVHSGDGAVLFEASLRLHQDGMPATMAVEDFLAR